jgi:hypothetical protein
MWSREVQTLLNQYLLCMVTFWFFAKAKGSALKEKNFTPFMWYCLNLPHYASHCEASVLSLMSCSLYRVLLQVNYPNTHCEASFFLPSVVLGTNILSLLCWCCCCFADVATALLMLLLCCCCLLLEYVYMWIATGYF